MAGFRSQDLKFLVDRHGQALSLIQKSLGTYDPSTGGVTGGSSTTYTVKCYFFNYSLGDIDGVNIVSGDRRVVINLTTTAGASIPTPEVGDEITGNGDKVSIVSVVRISSGGNPICYIAQVRE